MRACIQGGIRDIWKYSGHEEGGKMDSTEEGDGENGVISRGVLSELFGLLLSVKFNSICLSCSF